MTPRSIPQKLSCDAIVCATLNYIKPTERWCEIYPNDYCQKRFKFKVVGFEQDASGKNIVKLIHASYSDKFLLCSCCQWRLKRWDS